MITIVDSIGLSWAIGSKLAEVSAKPEAPSREKYRIRGFET